MDVLRLRELTVELQDPYSYAVIGVDTYGAPDEQEPYLCGTYSTEAEADAALKARKAQSPDIDYYVLPPLTSE